METFVLILLIFMKSLKVNVEFRKLVKSYKMLKIKILKANEIMEVQMEIRL